MVDKVIAMPRDKVTGRAGALPASALKEVDRALRLWLELA
jgi:mRNA-degrading endonuclease toxin of MazEF toxin-antitoxin module